MTADQQTVTECQCMNQRVVGLYIYEYCIDLGVLFRYSKIIQFNIKCTPTWHSCGSSEHSSLSLAQVSP